jgi:hypothetical protein
VADGRLSNHKLGAGKNLAVLMLALPVASKADVDAALSVIGSHGDDTELREHLVAGLRSYRAVSFPLNQKPCNTMPAARPFAAQRYA